MNTRSKDFAEELFGTWDSGIFEREDVEQVVAELRRLHSVNAELLEALKRAADVLKHIDTIEEILARNAITRAAGLNKEQE
jgi:alpha/beta superfamily hydrolase